MFKSRSLVSRNILLWNITSLARCWTSAIRISVAAEDNAVIREVIARSVFLFLRKTELVGRSGLIMLFVKQESVSPILPLWLYCVAESPREVSNVEGLC